MSLDLKPTLRAKGIRQKHLAEKLAVSEATVSQWLTALARGEHERVPATKARDLASLLDLPPGAIRPDLWPSGMAA